MMDSLDDTSRARAAKLSAQLDEALRDAYVRGAPRWLLEQLSVAQGWLRLVFEEVDIDSRRRWLEIAEQALAAWRDEASKIRR